MSTTGEVVGRHQLRQFLGGVDAPISVDPRIGALLPITVTGWQVAADGAVQAHRIAAESRCRNHYLSARTAVVWFSAATMALAFMSALPAVTPCALAASRSACVKPGGNP
jgi:hypothetical protein